LKDYFVEKDGMFFAGTHFLLDFWGARRLDDLHYMEEALRRSVDEAGATLLDIHLHRFTPNNGITGLALLAESHISVHTFPERDFAAFDIFMCGKALPEKALAVLKEAFLPKTMNISRNLRGAIKQK
jgi:S-adenosylmethionine decarboxylase